MSSILTLRMSCFNCYSSASIFAKISLKMYMYIFFSMWVFFHNHSRITGLQGKGEGNSLTPHYNLHPVHRHLDISLTISVGSSPLYIASSWTWTRNLWFPSATPQPLSYASFKLLLYMKCIYALHMKVVPQL